MHSSVITATEANRNLSNILNMVHYQHQSFDIKRGKEVIARIIPAAPSKMTAGKFNDFLKNLPHLDAIDKKDFLKTIKELRADLHETRDLWD